MAERQWNAHAFINIAVWLKLADAKGDAGPSIADARVVFGYTAAAEKGTSLFCSNPFAGFSASTHAACLACMQRMFTTVRPIFRPFLCRCLPVQTSM